MNNSNSPSSYFALVLNTPSSAALLSRYATLAHPLAHHCTVAFGTNDPVDLPDFFIPDDLGREFHIRVIGYKRRDDKAIEAVAVELVDANGRFMSTNFSTNKVPHVTIATDGITKPFEANLLLESGFQSVVGEILSVTLRHLYTTR